MHRTWTDFLYGWWWTILPIAWFFWSAYRSYLQYLYRRRTLEALGELAKSGKEVPSDLIRLLDTDKEQSRRYTRPYQWRQAILFGCLGIGFVLAHYINPPRYEGFEFVGIMLGCVAVTYALYAVVLRKPDDQ